MKIIPKNTKPKNYIWKKITMLDTLIVAIFLFSTIGILTSNISHKWAIALVIIVIGVIFMIPLNTKRLYQELVQFFKYLVVNKRKYMGKDIDKIIPFTKIDEEGYIHYPTYYAKVIEIGSKDFALLDDDLQEMDIESFTNALNCIGNNDVVDLVKIDRVLILDEYIENLKNMIDKEKDKKKKYILLSKLSDVSILNDKENPIYINSHYFVFYNSKKENLDISLSTFLENLEDVKIKSKILNQKETAVFLKYTFTREFDEREVKNIDAKDLLNWIKPKKIAFKSSNLYIDDKYSFISAVEDYPIEVGSAFMASAFNTQGIKTVMHIVGVDQQKAIKRVDRAINEIKARTLQGSDKASEELQNETHIDTMCELLVSLQNENEKLFDVSVTFSAINYDNLSTKAFRKKIFSTLRNTNLKVNNLLIRQFEGYLNSNISEKRALKLYERGINSSSLASCFPFVESKIMDQNGSYLGMNKLGKPVFIDIWKRNEYYNNSNGIVIGSSGSGKSYFLKTLLNHLYAENTKIFILDPENEYKQMCINVNGEMIDVGKGDKGRINPFHIYPVISESEDDNEELSSIKTTFNTHLRVLESFFRIILPNITDEALEILNNAIIKIYEEKGIGQAIDVTTLKPEDFPIFDDLIIYIKKMFEKEGDLYKRNILSSVLTHISKFGSFGRYSDLWNGKTTLNINTNFTVFNFQSLFAQKNNIVANAQMLLIFRFLEQQIINQKTQNEKENINRHSMILVDEAHMFIDSKFPISLDFFYQMTKRIRKYGGSFLPATQSISDWLSTEELRNKTSSILKNSQYSFVFKLKGQDVEDLCDLYKSSTPINTIEMRSIAKAKRGHCFLIASEDLRTEFYIDANDFIKTMFERIIDEEKLDAFINDEEIDLDKSIKDIKIIKEVENEEVKSDIDV